MSERLHGPEGLRVAGERGARVGGLSSTGDFLDLTTPSKWSVFVKFPDGSTGMVDGLSLEDVQVFMDVRQAAYHAMLEPGKAPSR